MKFCVYNAPKTITRDYDPDNNAILADNGSVDVGTIYYKFNGSWSTTPPTATEAGQYEISYYIKGDETHNDIGSEDSPAGTITSNINVKSVTGDGLTITLDTSSYIYDNTAKQPSVTVYDGTNVIPSTEYTVSYSSNVNAGTATVTITDNDGGNYTVSGSTTFTITKEQLVVTVTANDLYYNYEEQALVKGSAKGSGTYNSIQYSLDNVGYSTDVPTGKKVKTYTVYYKIDGDDNHLGTDVASLEVTINPKKVDNPKIEVSPSTFTYDGKPKEPDVRVYDGDTEILSPEFTVSYSSNTDVGTATVSISDNEGGTYTVSGTATFSIVSKDASYIPPTAKTGLVYNGSAQELVTVGSSGDGEMQYSLDGETYSTEIPMGTDAKTYSVYYKVVGDKNHEDSTPATVEVSISKKTVSKPTITLSASSFVYNGKAQEPKVTVTDGESEIPASQYTVSYSNNVNVGTATVTITGKDGGNYIVNGSTTFQIVDADSKVTAPTAKTSLTYNGKAQELVEAGRAEGGTLEYSTDGTNYSTSVPTGTDAKTYTVFYKVSGDNNHSDVEASSLSVTISPKTVDNPTITISPTSYTYDGSAKMPAVTVYEEDGETKIASSEYSVSYSNNTNAGTATVTVKDKEGGNYTVSGTASFSILSKDASYTPPTAKTGLTYNGEEQDLITVGSSEDGTMQYSSDGKTYSMDIPKGTDAKTYTVYYKVVGDDNHDSVSPVSLTVIISQKSVSDPTITLSKTSYVYDGTSKKPTVTVKDGETVVPASEYSSTYSDNVNVGKATVTITDNDGGNYIVNGSTTFQIVDADSKVTAPTAKTSLTYNGKAQELVEAGRAEGGTLEYSTDGSNYSASVPTGTDAKTYTVYYKVTGDDNYGDVEASSLSVTISPKTVDNPTITISPTSYTYDGSAKMPDVTVKDGDNLILSSEYSISYENNKNVGKATVRITDKEAGNYTVSGTANFYIKEEGSSYIPPMAKTGLVYTGSAQELITAGSTTTGTMHYYSLDGKNYSTDIPTGTVAKIYSVYYKVVGDKNHEDSPAVELSVTISSKDVTNPTIKLSPSSYFYDGKEKKPAVTVKDGDTTIDSKEYAVSYSNNTNIGAATVIITDKEGGNYIVSGKTTFSIIDPMTGFTPPSAIPNLEYNGTAQELIEAGSAPDEYTIVYSLDGKNYSADIPKGTDAQSYSVYAKVVDKDNKDKSDIEVYTLTATISPKKIFISVTLTDVGPNKTPDIKVVDVDGNELDTKDYSVTYTDMEGEEVTPDKGSIPAGAYTVTVSPTGNYTGPSVAKGILILKDHSFTFVMESDLIAICLPYDREKPAGYDIYRLSSIDRTGFPVFQRLNTTTLSAGEPYLFKYTGASTRGSRILDLSPSDSKSIDTSTKLQSQTAGNLIFVGTFQDMTNEYATNNGSYILQTDGTWKVPEDADNKICLEAFHAYLHYRNRSVHVSPMTMTLTDGGKEDPEPEPVAIDGVILEEEDGSRAWYDLQGHRLDGPQKGVNILRTEDGKTKKVVKK